MRTIEPLSGLAVHDEIRRELSSGEQVLWWGQPKRGFVLRASDAFVIPFALLWTAFSGSWLFAVVSSDAPWTMALFGVPFLGLGLYMLVGRFWVEAKQRARTFYAVTSQRVVIVSGLLTRSVKSLSLKTLSELTLREDSEGGGTITFGPQHPLGFMVHGMPPWPGVGQWMSPRFEAVAQVREVYEVIRQAQRGAGSL